MLQTKIGCVHLKMTRLVPGKTPISRAEVLRKSRRRDQRGGRRDDARPANGQWCIDVRRQVPWRRRNKSGAGVVRSFVEGTRRKIEGRRKEQEQINNHKSAVLEESFWHGGRVIIGAEQFKSPRVNAKGACHRKNRSALTCELATGGAPADARRFGSRLRLSAMVAMFAAGAGGCPFVDTAGGNAPAAAAVADLALDFFVAAGCLLMPAALAPAVLVLPFALPDPGPAPALGSLFCGAMGTLVQEKASADDRT